MRIRVLSPQIGTQDFDHSFPGIRAYNNLPNANLIEEDYPKDDIVGNDDIGTDDEVNDPYQFNFLNSSDLPRLLVVSNNAGHPGNTVEMKAHFGEFVRLLVGDKWMRISDFTNWRLDAKLVKNPQSQWVDNGSVSDASNNNW